MLERLAPTMKMQCKLQEAIETLRKSEAQGAELIQVVIDNEPSASSSIFIEDSLITQQAASNETWPLKYTLPAFPPVVTEALARKDKGFFHRERANVKINLINCLFDQICRYTW